MKYTFFYKSTNPFSNWYPSNFIHNKETFNCSEQYMMFQKALLFEDYETLVKIKLTGNPREQKALGRQVKNFNNDLWMKHCEEIMVDGLIAKFTSTPELKKFILDTGDTILVEASPYDKIWGIGLAETDPNRFDESKWRGTNLLGKVLMETREIIKTEFNDD